ncbi:MAG: hypothetical protein ABJC26_16650, partial [Gemmatimonadaceae bacterium]
MPNSVTTLISAFGALIGRLFTGVGEFARFVAATARASLDLRDWVPQFSAQARSLGVGSIPIGVFIAVFTG